MSAAPSWTVSRWMRATMAEARAMAAEAGVSVSALRAAGRDRVLVELTRIDATTLGDAIARARSIFPRVPVTALVVESAAVALTGRAG